MSLSVDRLVRNQILFREVNDRISDVVERFGDLREIDFVCECSQSDCVETVQLDLDEYKAIRSSPRLFVICPGHEVLEVENVIDRNERFALVEKTRHVDLVEDSHAARDDQSS